MVSLPAIFAPKFGFYWFFHNQATTYTQAHRECRSRNPRRIVMLSLRAGSYVGGVENMYFNRYLFWVGQGQLHKGVPPWRLVTYIQMMDHKYNLQVNQLVLLRGSLKTRINPYLKLLNSDNAFKCSIAYSTDMIRYIKNKDSLCNYIFARVT